MEYKVNELEIVLVIVIISVMLTVANVVLKTEKTPQHDSILSGKMYYRELMETLNTNRFLHACRMDKQTFELLLIFLKQHGDLKDWKSICAGEKLMIFISLLKVEVV